MVQARVTTVKVPVIRDIVCYTVDPALSPLPKRKRFQFILNFSEAKLGGRGCGPLTPNPFLYRGYHAAFGGRSQRRQPMLPYAYDVP